MDFSSILNAAKQNDGSNKAKRGGYYNLRRRGAKSALYDKSKKQVQNKKNARAQNRSAQMLQMCQSTQSKTSTAATSAFPNIKLINLVDVIETASDNEEMIPVEENNLHESNPIQSSEITERNKIIQPLNPSIEATNVESDVEMTNNDEKCLTESTSLTSSEPSDEPRINPTQMNPTYETTSTEVSEDVEMATVDGKCLTESTSPSSTEPSEEPRINPTQLNPTYETTSKEVSEDVEMATVDGKCLTESTSPSSTEPSEEPRNNPTQLNPTYETTSIEVSEDVEMATVDGKCLTESTSRSSTKPSEEPRINPTQLNPTYETTYNEVSEDVAMATNEENCVPDSSSFRLIEPSDGPIIIATQLKSTPENIVQEVPKVADVSTIDEKCVPEPTSFSLGEPLDGPIIIATQLKSTPEDIEKEVPKVAEGKTIDDEILNESTTLSSSTLSQTPENSKISTHLHQTTENEKTEGSKTKFHKDTAQQPSVVCLQSSIEVSAPSEIDTTGTHVLTFISADSVHAVLAVDHVRSVILRYGISSAMTGLVETTSGCARSLSAEAAQSNRETCLAAGIIDEITIDAVSSTVAVEDSISGPLFYQAEVEFDDNFMNLVMQQVENYDQDDSISLDANPPSCSRSSIEKDAIEPTIPDPQRDQLQTCSKFGCSSTCSCSQNQPSFVDHQDSDSPADNCNDSDYRPSVSSSDSEAESDACVEDANSKNVVDKAVQKKENSLSKTLKNSETETIPSTTRKTVYKGIKVSSCTTDKNKPFKRTNYCLYCGKPNTHIARHLKVMHGKEPAVAAVVAKASTLPKSQLARLFEPLRKEGDSKHNIEVLNSKSGVLRPTRRKRELTNAEDYVICVYCKGWVFKKVLHIHLRTCRARYPKSTSAETHPRYLAATAYVATHSKIDVDENFKKSVLERMVADEIHQAIVNDILILRFGNTLFENLDGVPTQVQQTRNNMREAARLLMAVKKLDNKISEFKDILNVQKWDVLVAAVLALTKMETGLSNAATPTLAIKCGYHIKKIGDIVLGDAIRNSDADLQKSIEAFMKISELQWFNKVIKRARRNISKKKLNRRDLLPLTEDLNIMSRYIHKELDATLELLENDTADNIDWLYFSRLLLVKCVMFNFKRVGEMSSFELSEYAKKTKGELRKDIAGGMTKSEKFMAEHMTRVETVGKCSKNVPVLLTEYMVKCLDKLIATRKEVGNVPDSNVYVFANPQAYTTGFINGYDAFRQLAVASNAKNPELIRSTKLRHHIATSSQIFDLNHYELEQLATFMGHTLDVHRNYYRLPDSTIQVAKISLLLHAMDKNDMSKFTGKSLDEIQLEDLPLAGDDSEDDLENDEAEQLSSYADFEQTTTTSSDPITQSPPHVSSPHVSLSSSDETAQLPDTTVVSKAKKKVSAKKAGRVTVSSRTLRQASRTATQSEAESDDSSQDKQPIVHTRVKRTRVNYVPWSQEELAAIQRGFRENFATLANYYSTKFAPPKKVAHNPELNKNVHKFLERKAEEERLKKEQDRRKRDELLNTRSQDPKSKKRVSLMLKSTKSASKAAIADARDDNNTAITMLGPSQPDEDDYGYTSKEASAFYDNLMNKYSNAPLEEDKFSKKKKTSVKSSKEITETMDRVKLALNRERDADLLPHKRKRRTKEKVDQDHYDDGDRYSDKEEDVAPAPTKPKRPPPPPMDFRELLQLAAQKQHEPIVIEKKPVPKENENERPMTKRERKEYERQKEWEKHREARRRDQANRDREPAPDSTSKRPERPETTGATPTFTRIPKKTSSMPEDRRLPPPSRSDPKGSKSTDSPRENFHSSSQKSSQVPSKLNGSNSSIRDAPSKNSPNSRSSDRDFKPTNSRPANRSPSTSYSSSSNVPSKSKPRDDLNKPREAPIKSSNVRDSEKRPSLERRPLPPSDKRLSSERKPQGPVRSSQEQNKRPSEPMRKQSSDQQSRRPVETNRKPETDRPSQQSRPQPRQPEQKQFADRREEQDRRTTPQDRRPPLSKPGSSREPPTQEKRPLPPKPPGDRRPVPPGQGERRPAPPGEKRPNPSVERRPVPSGMGDRRPMQGQGRPGNGMDPRPGNGMGPRPGNGMGPRPGQQRPMLKKRPSQPVKRRIESDSEYDSELDDFIDDGPLEGEEDYSKAIREIFNYDKSRYRDDYDDECMESNFAQQQREEVISAKAGLLEDLEDIRQEKEELKRKEMRKKQKRK